MSDTPSSKSLLLRRNEGKSDSVQMTASILAERSDLSAVSTSTSTIQPVPLRPMSNMNVSTPSHGKGGSESKSPSPSPENSPSLSSASSFKAPPGMKLFNEEDELAALAKREAFVNLRWRILLFTVGLELFLWLMSYFGGRYNFNMDNFAEKEFSSYHYQYSLSDLFVILLIKSFIHLLNIVTLRSDTQRSFFLSSCSYWVAFTALILAICKLVVYDDWGNAAGGFLVVFAFLCCLVEIFCASGMQALDGSNAWDPYEQEEAEAKRARAAAAATRDAKAAEKRKTLSGEELAAFDEKERARKAADDYLEQQIERTSKLSKHKQKIRFSEFRTMLRPYFWPDGCHPRFLVVLTWTALIGSKVMSIIGPLFIGYAADQLVHEGTVPWKYIILYCFFQSFGFALRQFQNAIYLRVKQEAFAQLAKITFRHLHSLSLSWHLKKKMGNVLRSMDRGISSADTVVSYLFLYLLPSIVESLVVFIIFYTYFGQPLLSAVIFIHLVLYFVVTVQITIWRKRYRKATNKHDNDFHDKATDSLINYETVKYFGNEDYEAERYIDSIRKYQKYNVSTQVSLSVLNTLQTLVIQMSLMFSMMITAYRISQGELSIGDFSAVNAYVLNLFQPLSFLGSIYDSVVQAFVDMSNLSELLAEEPDIVDKPNAQPLHFHDENSGAKIEFRNVCFRYPEQVSGIQNVSFVVEPGTTTAIVGSTGAGKSTIARLLFRFYEPSEGGVYIDDQNISDVTQRSLRLAIGVVPQDTCMFNETLLHNIKYGKLTATLDEVEEACRSAQILEFIEAQKAQWETKVGERGLRLSGGEKQRVAIARALLKDPPIVLLDEATSALDSVKEQEIQSALRSLERGRTTLVIAHRLSTIKHAEQILVLEKGQVVERGTHVQLLEIPGGRYAQLWNQQASSAFGSAEEAAAAFEAATASGILTVANNTLTSPAPSPSPSPSSASTSTSSSSPPSAANGYNQGDKAVSSSAFHKKN